MPELGHPRAGSPASAARRRSPPAPACSQPGAGLGRVGEHGQHGRRAVEVRDALLARSARQIRAGSTLRRQTCVRAGRGDRPREAPAVAVEHRQRPQVHRRRRQPGVRRPSPAPAGRRRGGGTSRPSACRWCRRVVDREQRPLVGRPDRRVGVASASSRSYSLADAATTTRTSPSGRARRATSSSNAGSCTSTDGPASAPRCRRPRPRRAGCSARPAARPAHGTPKCASSSTWRVRREHRDRAPVGDARAQRAGQPPAALVQLGVGQAPVAVDHGDAVAVAALRPVQERHGVSGS